MQQKQGICPKHGPVLATREGGVNHAVHALITFFTCGMWGFVWLFLIIGQSSKPFRCTQCGIPV